MDEGKLVVHDRQINIVFWSNDIVMVTKNENRLRRMLKTLEEYTNFFL